MEPVVGLLPLYVELYDRSVPELRPRIEAHLGAATSALARAGIRVVAAPVCRLADEFETAVAEFERAGVDAIVTLHLAYSPSLEVESALCGTPLPVIVLDSTPEWSFDERTDPSAMMLNHGIHGVQDMCNRLVRRGKRFEIHAGHLDNSDVLGRVRASALAAAVANRLRRARVGLVGEPFAGMGDFRVDFDELRRDLGVTVVPAEGELPSAEGVSRQTVEAELAADLARFDRGPGWSGPAHELTTRAGLAMRSWIERESLTAVTVNFLAAHPSNPMLPVMPFLECSKAMERGLGYAGEGDVLTAAWVGALLDWVPETTFTEMFCPDWSGDSVFLSHMGEFNYRVSDSRPELTTLGFPYTPAADPSVAYGSLRPGRAVLANLAPFGDGHYRVTIAPGQVRRAEPENRMSNLVNGWFAADTSLPVFLEEFSRRGATHHSALVYGGPEVVAVLLSVARLIGADAAVI